MPDAVIGFWLATMTRFEIGIETARGIVLGLPKTPGRQGLKVRISLRVKPSDKTRYGKRVHWLQNPHQTFRRPQCCSVFQNRVLAGGAFVIATHSPPSEPARRLGFHNAQRIRPDRIVPRPKTATIPTGPTEIGP